MVGGDGVCGVCGCARLAIRPSVDGTESRWGQHTHNTRRWRRRAAWHLCVTLVRVVLCSEACRPMQLASLTSFAVITLHPIRRAAHHPIGALSHTIRSFNSVFSPLERTHWSPKYSADLSRFADGNFEKDHHRRGTEHRHKNGGLCAVPLFSSLPTKPANASQRFASIFFASIFSNSRPRSYHISKERF